jgi:hypothetical protein
MLVVTADHGPRSLDHPFIDPPLDTAETAHHNRINAPSKIKEYLSNLGFHQTRPN